MSVIVRSWGCRYWDCEMVTFHWLHSYVLMCH